MYGINYQLVYMLVVVLICSRTKYYRQVSKAGCVIFFRGTHKVRNNFRSIFNYLF